MNWILTKLGIVKSDLGRILSTFEKALSNLEAHVEAKGAEATMHGVAEVEATPEADLGVRRSNQGRGDRQQLPQPAGALMQASLPVLLFVVFLVLKLCGVIAWSWLWVTAPLWIGIALCLVVLAAVLLVAGLAVLFGRGR